ncbi:MAG: hypothetical protein KDD32_00780 [Bacteroidetes bacterium]|nr:hypothetical protein [Bacteroidota bacterium]
MESLEAKKLINKIQKGLLKNGIDAEAVAADLRTLRPYALEEKDPLVTKVIRMAYEHIEATGTFDIDMPEEELDEDDEAVEKEEADDSVDTRVESLDFFLSLLANSENKINRPDISAYKFAFMAYAEE